MSGKIKACLLKRECNDCGGRIAEHFLCAGASALLISIPHFYPQLWILSFCALIPFLWRVVQIRFSESLLLGAMLAACYCFVVFPLVSWMSPDNIILKLSGFCLLFALFAGAVNRIARHIGMNAVFIAILWLPLEHFLNSTVKIGNILALPESETGMVFRIGTLFGMLVVSFLVVLVNLLLFILLKQTIEALKEESELNLATSRESFIIAAINLPHSRSFTFPLSRSPPIYGLVRQKN
jgi:apolipoprotein N-acyltransferase